MKVDRRINREVNIPKKKGEEVMRNEGGGGYTAEMGCGYDGSE